jgi:hypothetical protein
MMKKNSQIHLYLETEILERLKKQANELGVSISELCRRKLKEIPQISRIEYLLIDLNKKLTKDLIISPSEKTI